MLDPITSEFPLLHITYICTAAMCIVYINPIMQFALFKIHDPYLEGNSSPVCTKPHIEFYFLHR